MEEDTDIKTQPMNRKDIFLKLLVKVLFLPKQRLLEFRLPFPQFNGFHRKKVKRAEV